MKSINWNAINNESNKEINLQKGISKAIENNNLKGKALVKVNPPLQSK